MLDFVVFALAVYAAIFYNFWNALADWYTLYFFPTLLGLTLFALVKSPEAKEKKQPNIVYVSQEALLKINNV